MNPARSGGHARPSSRSSAAAQGQRATRERIKRLILDRRLRPGDPIPTENQLVQELGLSRNSVREALKALQAIGIIEVRHGFGSYVGQLALNSLADGLVFRGQLSLQGDRRDLWELIDVREALEIGFIARVVRIASDRDLELVEEALTAMEAPQITPEASERADRLFHERLYAPLKNQLMLELFDAFWVVYHDLIAESGNAGHNPDAVVAEHRGVYDAVASRNSATAIAAVQRIFDTMRQRLSTANSGNQTIDT